METSSCFREVYVQHKIMEQADSIWANLGREGSRGYFFLCGSKQPEKDVFAALIKIFETKGGALESISGSSSGSKVLRMMKRTRRWRACSWPGATPLGAIALGSCKLRSPKSTEPLKEAFFLQPTGGCQSQNRSKEEL